MKTCPAHNSGKAMISNDKPVSAKEFASSVAARIMNFMAAVHLAGSLKFCCRRAALSFNTKD